MRIFEYEYELTDFEVGKAILIIIANKIQNHFTVFKTSIHYYILIIQIFYQTISIFYIIPTSLNKIKWDTV